MNELKNLIGKEMSMYELDNEMMTFGFYSEGESIGLKEVVESGCIYYHYAKETDYENENGVVIDFEIISWNEEEEGIDCTIVKIIGVR